MGSDAVALHPVAPACLTVNQEGLPIWGMEVCLPLREAQALISMLKESNTHSLRSLDSSRHLISSLARALGCVDGSLGGLWFGRLFLGKCRDDTILGGQMRRWT